jgi:ribose-phosphate pyrophosphokinase
MHDQPYIAFNTHKIPYKTFLFPSGELGVEVLEMDESFLMISAGHSTAFPRQVSIYAELVTVQDIFTFLLVMNVLKNRYKREFILNLPYIPFARQDRHTTPNTPFSLKVFADLINALDFKEVYLTTPHSNVAGLLIKNSVVMDVEDWITSFLIRNFGNDSWSYDPKVNFNKNIVFIAPDVGADKRVFSLAQRCGVSEVITCLKKRNPANGEIEGLTVPVIDNYRKHFIVVDDICDGGRTFIELAKALPVGRLPPTTSDGSISLLVTHGIFSNGARQKLLDAGYDRVEAKFTFIEDRLNAQLAPTK